MGNSILKQLETSFIQQQNDGHYSVYTEIVINAPIEKVWKIVSDFDNLKNWSTSLIGISGDRTNGGKVKTFFNLMEQIWETDHVFIYEENSHFGWSDGLTGDFSKMKDNHLFKVESISENQTRFIQTDEFTGTDSPLHGLTLARIGFDSYPQFNRELLLEAEKK